MELYPYTVSNEAEFSNEWEIAIEALWPNPARSSISLQLRLPEAGHVQVSVFDLLGREVLVWEDMIVTHRETIQLQLSELPTGSYIVRISSGNQIGGGVLFTRIE